MRVLGMKEILIFSMFSSLVLLYAGWMVEADDSLTKNWENHWADKPSLIPLKKENGLRERPLGLKVKVINTSNETPSSVNTIRAVLNKDHRIIKRNASFITPTLPDNFTVDPPIAVLPIPVPIPVLYPVCENEKSCFGRCTNKGRTESKTEMKLTCSCDPDCYEVFNDCCADYVKYCGVQEPQDVSSKQYKWTCQAFGHVDAIYCTIADGIWMVSECSNDWPNDTTRTKCETPLQKLSVSSTDLTRYLPVVTKHNITFRNRYCAVCNKVNEPYEPWPLDIDTTVVPPENYNLTQKIQFLLTYGAKVRNRGPKTSQPRRYCLTEQLVDTCSSDQSSSLCKNGPTAIVWAGRNLKNLNCAFCNGIKINETSCFPGDLSKRCEFFRPQSFSLVLDTQRRNNDDSESEFSLAKQTCGKQGMVFDDILQVCRISWSNPPAQAGQHRFIVIAWLAPQQIAAMNDGFSAEDFQKSLSEYLNVSSHQIFDVNISSIVKPDTFIFTFSGAVSAVEFFLVSSTIILNPQENLKLLSIQRNNQATTELRLVNFIYFKDPFLMNITNRNYTIAKTTSRPLACSGKMMYTTVQYTLLDGGSVYINSTNTTYGKSQYFRDNSQQLNGSTLGDNITVCEKYIPAGCNAEWITLAPNEFTILANLSIYHNETLSLYQYGQYDIHSNGSISVCVSVKHIYIFKTIRDNEVLGWITFVGFFLSILFLIFLLVTYILFPQLRTLPGKNLMNLAATLLFFELLWIIPGFDNLRKRSSLCTAIAVLVHYGLLAYFVSMSVIALHTCKVFARQLPALKSSKSHERKLFILYSMLVWLVPAIFVIICFILDKKQIAHLGYGDSEVCFVGVEDNTMYFITVTIPMAVSLLFNIVAFVTSVIYLRKHGQNNAVLTHSTAARHSNLLIYMKLSTLMGFSWLFGFLAYIFDGETVFWYLFIILTSLQGVFITIAFVFNTKTLKLYRRSTNTSQKSSTATRTTRRNLTHNDQNTKL